VEQAFSLVKDLAAELSAGELRLPSLPETVVRIRNTLSKQDFSVVELARLISAEPALVGGILTMANSFAFRRSGKETTDLQVAISRIGAGMVRNVATAFALRQLRARAEFKAVEHLLAPEWTRSTRAATVTYLVAQRSRAVKPDEALVLGLLHNIGRIYLYSRAPQFPELFASAEKLEELLASWQAGVGKAIIESWHLPESVAEAVGRQDDGVDDGEECPPMVDILTVSLPIVRADNPPEEVLDALTGRADAVRLKLTREQLAEIVAERDSAGQSLGLG
jgi:HD-like signal output (HDOD) protein